MRTPGREPEIEFEAEVKEANFGNDDAITAVEIIAAPARVAVEVRAEQVIAAFSCRENLVNVDAWITRLRMEFADTARWIRRVCAVSEPQVSSNSATVSKRFSAPGPRH